MRSGFLSLRPLHKASATSLPIDLFFQSLARDQGNNAVGVVLSGTGSDGTLGIQAISKAHGLVMATRPARATLRLIPTSGFPNFNQEVNMARTAPAAAATCVTASCSAR